MYVKELHLAGAMVNDEQGDEIFAPYSDLIDPVQQVLRKLDGGVFPLKRRS